MVQTREIEPIRWSSEQLINKFGDLVDQTVLDKKAQQKRPYYVSKTGNVISYSYSEAKLLSPISYWYVYELPCIEEGRLELRPVNPPQ